MKAASIGWRGILDISYHPSETGIGEMSMDSTRKLTQEQIDAFSDNDLALRIQNGNNNLISELVARHSDRLFLIIIRMVHHNETAEDILQETWIRVMRKFYQYDAARSFSPWVTRIAVNCCRDHWRREKRRSLFSFLSPRETPIDIEDDTVRDPIIETDISKAIAMLSPRLKEVVVLKFFSGLTHDEIAQILGKPSGTIKSRLHLALAEMRNYLNRKGALS